MPAPDPSLIERTPPPLNPRQRFPFRVQTFPWDVVFGLGGLSPRDEYRPQGEKENPLRFAD